MKLKREGACVVLQVFLGEVGMRMKNCLRNGHLEACHGGNFLLYSHLLGNFCCWKPLKLKTNVDQAGLLFFVFVYLFLYRICKESACFPKLWLIALKGEGNCSEVSWK